MTILTTAVGGLRSLFSRRPIDAGSRSGRSYAITLLTPVRAGDEAALAADIEGLGLGEKSPLAKLPYVHFARFLLIEQLRTQWPGAPNPPPRLLSTYLLFTASLTAPGEPGVTDSDESYAERLPRSFFEEIRTRVPGDADAIWGHCVGYPGSSNAEGFVEYLATSQLETSLFHVGYPDVTVDQVRDRLAARDSLIAFCLDHQSVRDDAQLQQAYVKESSTWFPST